MTTAPQLWGQSGLPRPLQQNLPGQGFRQQGRSELLLHRLSDVPPDAQPSLCLRPENELSPGCLPRRAAEHQSWGLPRQCPVPSARSVPTSAWSTGSSTCQDKHCWAGKRVGCRKRSVHTWNGWACGNLQAIGVAPLGHGRAPRSLSARAGVAGGAGGDSRCCRGALPNFAGFAAAGCLRAGVWTDRQTDGRGCQLLLALPSNAAGKRCC